MGIVGPLLLLGGAIYVFSKRCELLGVCGDTAADSGTTTTTDASAEPVAATPEEVGKAANPGMSQSRGCCECKMVGDRVKCQKNGDGNWFNPPAGEGGSNDQDIGLSLIECYKGCGSSSTTKSKPTGNNSNPSANKPKTGNLGEKGTTYAKGGSKGSVVKPKAGSGAAQYFNANPKGYKPGGGTYYTRSFFVDPNYVRPFNLYHRIAN